MTGPHTTGNDAHRDRNPDRNPDRAAEPGPGRRGAVRSVLRVVLWLAALAAVAFTAVVVYGFIRFNHDIDHPKDGFSGWQCADQSGTCDR